MPKSKNRRKFDQSKLRLTKEGKRKVINDKIDTVASNLARIEHDIGRLNHLSEANRLGLVTVNHLMSESEWPTALTKLRHFIFGIASVLMDEFPSILERAHTAIDGGNINPRLVEVLGDISLPIGYSKSDFERMFSEIFGNVHLSNKQSRTEAVADLSEEDEEGEVFDDEIARLNRTMSTHGSGEYYAKIVADEPKPVAQSNPVDDVSKLSNDLVDTDKCCDYCGAMFSKNNLSDHIWVSKKYCSKACSRKAKYRRKHGEC